VSFVLPSLPTNTTPQIQAKATFLEEEVKKLDNIKVVKLNDIEYDGIHPTEEGTKMMMQQLNESFDKELILDGAEISDLTTKRYNKVQALFKVGCRGCETTDFTPYLCNTCKDTAKTVNVKLMLDILARTEEEMFPKVNVNSENNTDDVDMEKQDNKRGRDEDDNISSNKLYKS